MRFRTSRSASTATRFVWSAGAVAAAVVEAAGVESANTAPPPNAAVANTVPASVVPRIFANMLCLLRGSCSAYPRRRRAFPALWCVLRNAYRLCGLLTTRRQEPPTERVVDEAGELADERRAFRQRGSLWSAPPTMTSRFGSRAAAYSLRESSIG